MIHTIRLIKNAKQFYPHSKLLNSNLYPFGTVKTFILPDLGEKIKEATVKEWHVKIGDEVEEFQTLADVSTDKLFTQIPSSYTGKIHKLYYEVDDIALVGEPFLEIEVDGEEGETAAAPQQQQSSSGQETTTQTQQQTITPTSQQATANKVLATPSTRGKAKEMNININQVRGTGPDGRVTDADLQAFQNGEQSKPVEKKGTHADFATPSALNIMIQHDIDASQVVGTGRAGRIMKWDVIEYLKNPQPKKQPQQSQQKQQKQSAPKPAGSVQEFTKTTYKMDQFQQGMQKSMTAANAIPHLYIKEEIDITNSAIFREGLKKQGHKITFMSIFLKSFSLALKEFPVINATYNPEKPFEYEIVENHNITVAIDSPFGLVVPNIKNVQNLNLLEIQEELGKLRDKAKLGQLGPKELFEGSVTISNIGTIGGTYANPLIFAPQTSIVAIGRTQELPKYINNEFVPRKCINVSLGCDHRVIDGATATQFINKWKQYLEDPTTMLLKMN